MPRGRRIVTWHWDAAILQHSKSWYSTSDRSLNILIPTNSQLIVLNKMDPWTDESYSYPTGGLPHYCGINPRSYTLQGALGDSQPSQTRVSSVAIPESVASPYEASGTSQELYALCPKQECKWISGNVICGQEICCGDLSAHFAAIHNIRRIRMDKNIPCLWAGCEETVKRKGLMRHIRETRHHLGHGREGTGHSVD